MYPENPFAPKRNQFGTIYPGGQATRPVIYPQNTGLKGYTGTGGYTEGVLPGPVTAPSSPTAPGSSLTQPPRPIRGEYYMPDPGERSPWDIYRRQDPSQFLQPGSSLTQPPRPIRGEYYMPDPGERSPWDIYRRQDPSQFLQPGSSLTQPPRPIRGEYYMPDPGEGGGGFFADLLRRAMGQFGQTQQGQLPNLYNLRGMGGQFGGFSDVQDPYRAFFTRLLS